MVVEFSETNGDEIVRVATERKTVNLTPEQTAIAAQLSKAAGFKSVSAWMKHLMAEAAAGQGVKWPPDMNTWGGERKVKKLPQK